jgi:regulator of PEP synthase PpsR (kinase-PPPase family)
MYHIFAVSDATGTTAERVLGAALSQFDASQITLTRFGGVRTVEKVSEVVAQAAKKESFIVHTFVSEELRRVILKEGREHNVSTIDLMGPLLARLAELLATPPRSEPGLFDPFDPSYLQRIEAIDFTVRHDDGQNFYDLDRAEIVLVGVSRTSKTPLSFYLGYRGWKVANVPIVLDIEPPSELFDLPKGRVVGLIINPERLSGLRKVRAQRMGTFSKDYAELEHIHQEMDYAFRLFERRRDWPLVDVTTKSIEETAAEVVVLLGRSVDAI